MLPEWWICGARWGPDSNPGTPTEGPLPAACTTHLTFLPSAAVGPASKKPEGTGQVGNPKHCPPKAPGRPEAGAAHKPRVSHLTTGHRVPRAQGGDWLLSWKHATGCKKHEQSSDKAKKPKVKKEKKKKKAPH
uniref:Uncharacterized protein n=1 Tax=Peromyscus maniculatus bairdii TaxID=230844 RepID=A0A8C8UKD2_PERMB